MTESAVASEVILILKCLNAVGSHLKLINITYVNLEYSKKKIIVILSTLLFIYSVPELFILTIW